MDGILNILKPAGMTSFDVVAQVRRLLKVKKVGHTGTLDPDAVGVLPVCIGKATRMVEMLMEDHKFYRGEVTLGIATDTEDASGEVIDRQEVGEITSEQIETVLQRFRGTIEQVPPMVSALKHEGKRLYELARQGIEVERKARQVEIYSLQLLRMELPRFWIDVECSKGTYIRTLARDIGQALGTCAHLSYLIRTGTGEFALERTVTLEEIAEAGDRAKELLLPVEWGVRHLPIVVVHSHSEKKALNGAKLQDQDYQTFPTNAKVGDLVRVYLGKEFISLAQVESLERKIVQPVKVFA